MVLSPRCRLQLAGEAKLIGGKAVKLTYLNDDEVSRCFIE